ncbi:sensory transduction histidine kinase [Bartonella australis AUST/NH1]|uniref:histidine kinase n=1 Tax=Bartonella australis (strain Aust/NH1) TaxID=1094489 RepID=M1N4Y2_BARAA|nr:PAS domain-containing sensor histidine kinase [Bartonella australis]AGF74944.1 sensory transduction histidine kinase [Bartonella australis AUST/NH1]
MIVTPVSAPPMDRSHLSALMQAIRSAGICVLYQTTNLTYLWAENLPKHLHNKWRVGCRDSDFFSLDLADNMETIKLQVLATGKKQTIEARFEDMAKQAIWYKFSVDCHRNDNGEVIGIITTGVDISGLRRREHVLKVLLREVSHRSKNLLAIIQSIASQTARYTESLHVFLRKFQGRIHSLSNSQDLVTDSDWRGAQFRELVQSQALGYLAKEIERFSIEGVDPYLFPNAALHIGLAFHELIVNSLSFGALSQEGGNVTVRCEIQKKVDENTQLVITWSENFEAGTILSEHNKSCFGSTVLEKIVPISVNGSASLKLTKEGLVYCLYVPDSYFDTLA